MESIHKNNIQFHLKKLHRSQLWLSRELGITTNTLSVFCTNKRQPKLDILYKIADALNIDILHLISPNNYSGRIVLPLTKTISNAETKRLNEIIKAMFKKKSILDSAPFLYPADKVKNLAVSHCDENKVFDYLISILIQDNIIEIVEKGLAFTARGALLMANFKQEDKIEIYKF